MDKRTLLQLLLFSVVIITGCSKYEDEDYSCNKEVNQWAKSNLNEIKKMKVAEWYSTLIPQHYNLTLFISS